MLKGAGQSCSSTSCAHWSARACFCWPNYAHLIMPFPYTLELSREEDLSQLLAVEREAAALFHSLGMFDAVLADETPLEDFREAHARGHLWVARAANGEPIAFAFLEVVDGQIHLDELDVHPSHGRRGVGRALVEAVCAWAHAAGYTFMTLTTFRDVPWNAPFYASAGFRPVAAENLTPQLREVVAEETARGLDPAKRLVMRRDLAAT
jgi:GNAT superfamily N-acetyltransferase